MVDTINIRDEYDVIVIGAGFGGPVAARKCARAGLRTLMLERSGSVGEKVISGLTIPFYGFLFGPDFIRDGDPPIERPVDGIINYIIKDIEKGDIDIDDSLRIPRPLSPVFALGYNAYCKPFCQWEAEKAMQAGAELRTSCTVTGVMRENGKVCGVVLDSGEEIRCKLVIDAEGSQGLVAVKAGVRKRYPPEVISLADVYDYQMSKEEVDRIFGFTLRFCWGWDEQMLAPPLGHGNGLMVWPYRESVHMCQDQCLRMDKGEVPDLKELFEVYHRNITSQLPWWVEEIAPRARLRARMWEGFEIFVGLDLELRGMPNYTDGMILIGDAAGLENTELCDGVPTAWFSADIAADVAIEAIRSGDTSASFLKRYDERIKAHPIIQWAISGTNRYNLRFAQEKHDERLLKKFIHEGWGLGGFTHVTSPLLQAILESIEKDPTIIVAWLRMYFRYYYNWIHQRYDYSGCKYEHKDIYSRKPMMAAVLFRVALDFMEGLLRLFSPLIKIAARFFKPASRYGNNLVKMLMPVLEPFWKFLLSLEDKMEPATSWINRFIEEADPAIFASPSRRGGCYDQNL